MGRGPCCSIGEITYSSAWFQKDKTVSSDDEHKNITRTKTKISHTYIHTHTHTHTHTHSDKTFKTFLFQAAQERVKEVKSTVDQLYFQASAVITWADIDVMSNSFDALSKIEGSLEQINQHFQLPGKAGGSVFSEALSSLRSTITSAREAFGRWLHSLHTSMFDQSNVCGIVSESDVFVPNNSISFIVRVYFCAQSFQIAKLLQVTKVVMKVIVKQTSRLCQKVSAKRCCL